MSPYHDRNNRPIKKTDKHIYTRLRCIFSKVLYTLPCSTRFLSHIIRGPSSRGKKITLPSPSPHPHMRLLASRGQERGRLFELARFRSHRANPGFAVGRSFPGLTRRIEAFWPCCHASFARSNPGAAPKTSRFVSSGITSRPVKSEGRRRHLLESPRPPRQTPLPRRRREEMETRAEVVVSHRPARSTHDDGSLPSPWSGIRTLFSCPTEGPKSRLT